jgi:hypothetical protein
MATDRLSLSSVRYWTGERQPQRFYIAFCLLMSSIQDCLLGSKEQRSANLNWSTTCSYYSLVHAGRLLTFVALGDYPTQHAGLRQLLGTTGTQPGRRPQSRDGYPFDWLRRFTIESSPPSPTNSELREALLQYLTDTGVARAAEGLDRFGSVLAAAAELRNDSNYEALLIAHEYEHVTVTPAFEELARHMAAASHSSLRFVVEAFTCFLREDPHLETDRAGYSAFVQDYLECRLVPAIDRKLSGFDDLKRELRQVVACIGLTTSDVDYHLLEYKTSLDIFGGKTQLIGAFQSRIDDLERAIGEQVL